MKWLLLVALGSLAMVAGWFGWNHFHVPAHDAEQCPELAWFQDVADEVGLDFVHDAGPLEGYFMPQIMGSGAALFDFDGDGRLDLFLLTNGGPQSKSTNRLYRNLGGGKFADATAGSGLGFGGHNMGVAIGDVNNDGRPDVLVTQYGGIKLLLNRGDGTFEDVSEGAGLANPGWGASAAFLDYDRDGWLDLVVVNYVDYDPSWHCTSPTGTSDYCSPRSFPGSVARLFRNLGAASSAAFREETLPSGLGRTPGPGLGVLCADVDGDGWCDIFVANDAQPNYLWINQRNGTFKEEAVLRGVAYSGTGRAQAGMGVAYGDVDGDGLMDLFVTHLRGETHTLWRQQPRGLFLDRTAASGLARPRWQGTGFGTVLGDFDLDGHLDLAVVNGHVARADVVADSSLGPHWGWYADRHQLFANDGKGSFTDISQHNRAFCGHARVGRGLACGDVDGDGRLDLLVTSVADRARLYHNVAPQAGHWLMVRTRLPSPRDPADARKDRDAYGAEITVHAGARRWVRLVNPADSYLCSSDPRAHFGLGEASHVDGITVRWPDGMRERFAGTQTDRLVEVRKGQGHPEK